MCRWENSFLTVLFSPKTVTKLIMKIEIDHIDPRWKEGREYQLVCGLDLPLNYNEVTREFNTSKSNRFLPYRVTSNDLGCIPCEPGDFCLFWDPDTEDWVLEEFLGEWWYDKTDRYSGGCRALEEWRQENKGKVGRALQKNRKDPGYEVRKQWEFYKNNPDKLAERNEKIGGGFVEETKQTLA